MSYILNITNVKILMSDAKILTYVRFLKKH